MDHDHPESGGEDNKSNEEASSMIQSEPKLNVSGMLSPGMSDPSYSDVNLPPGYIDRKVSEDSVFTISHSSHLNKPSVRFEITLAVNLFQIKELFEKVCKKRGFEIVDDEGDAVTAVHKKVANLKDLLFSCIPTTQKNFQHLTAIRLHSKTNKVTCIRKITLKALLGDMKLANNLFLDFEKELEGYDGRRATSPRMNTEGASPSVVVSGQKYVQMRDDITDNDESVISIQNLEITAFYEFRKVLSQEQYSIGKKVADFIGDFFGNYKSITESAELLPQPMESVFLLVNEMTELFFADFNYGKSETKSMMPYCRISVEKYVFDKLYSHLYQMYLLKYEPKQRAYEEKAKVVREKQDIVSQLKFLDIPQKFWLIPADKLDQNQQLINPLGPADIPYIDAINEFSKISRLKSPREKLGVLLMMHSLMKSAVIDYHKAREEILSMDEELPIMIYCFLHVNVPNAVAELAFVDDYAGFDPALESERRLMTNLRVSLQYIADEWPTN